MEMNRVPRPRADSSEESAPPPILSNSLMIFVAGLSTEYPAIHNNSKVEGWTHVRTFSSKSERLFGEKGSIENLDDIVKELLDFVLHSAADIKDLSELSLGFMAADLGGMMVKRALLNALSLVKYREIYERTSLLAFFGTPHQESKVYSWETTILSIIEDTYRGLWGPWFPDRIRQLSLYLEKLRLGFNNISDKFRILNYVQDLLEPSSEVLTVHKSCAELQGFNITNIRRNVTHCELTRFVEEPLAEDHVVKRIVDAQTYLSKGYRELIQ
ncbi:hypothetical protein F4813DRAFT_323290 [Daldinia decipiens]|uniref:uncharacterized protein n=1 Tax=Daldinia decipiens TaxID=326647 RepID=UPI0020C31BCC|nr:uncharacterized protein F4813DRAFT_323290 [Daldinia decipiens]KAI1659746.1 hypothetical protein F4813DRAFT_323290 [Daldinia decipiens]